MIGIIHCYTYHQICKIIQIRSIQNEGSITLTESFPFIDQDLIIHHGLEQFLVTNGFPIYDPDLGTEEILQLICELEDVSHADEFS